jgi:hypothetical protein
MNLNDLASRKFILTVVVLVLSFVMVLAQRLDTQTWMQMAVAIVGVYSAANVIQDFASGKTETPTNPTP